MTISNQHNFIFISVPKTGTTSVQRFIKQNDKSACKNYIPRTKKTKRMLTGKDEHITADKLKKIMGSSYNVIIPQKTGQ